MSDFQLNISALTEKFHGFKADIMRLLKERDSFRILCEDYLQCRKALQYWNQSDAEEAPLRRREYESLLRELEAEILENLTESG